MGGAGYIFTGEHDADVMHNSATINLNVLDIASAQCQARSSIRLRPACIPTTTSKTRQPQLRREDSAYPAKPGQRIWLGEAFSERLYLAYHRNYGMECAIARYHNIFGPEGTWTGGKEKAPAAICRKVSETQAGGDIEIWGDGKQTRPSCTSTNASKARCD